MTIGMRAGIVGTGLIRFVHFEALRRLAVQIVGVVGSSPGRARARTASDAAPRVDESYDEMLADPGIDVVHLTKPSRVHCTQARAALQAGEQVIEKPLAIPAGHAEGFPDTRTIPTSPAGHREALVAEAILLSARDGRWTTGDNRVSATSAQPTGE
jgi:hypothetical protein